MRVSSRDRRCRTLSANINVGEHSDYPRNTLGGQSGKPLQGPEQFP